MRPIDYTGSPLPLCDIRGRRVLALAAVLLAFFGGFLGICDAASLSATLDRDVVPLGEQVTLTLTFEGANPGATPNLPPIDGLTIASVGTSSEFTIVNGQAASKLSYAYTLNTAKAGEIIIPALRIRVGGQDLTSPPLKLKVAQAGAQTQTAQAENRFAFLRLTVPKTNLFVGEPLLVDINLYVIEGRDARAPQLETPGFTVGKVQQQNQTRTRVGNQLFTLVPFRTYVSPVRSGSLMLGPATMQMAVPRPNARRSIFGDVMDWQAITLTAEPQVLNVKLLPRTNVPPTFNGAVGNFSMNVTVNPTNVAVGDPITLKVSLAGQGLIDSLSLPSQAAWSDFKVYPPTSKVEAADPFGLSGSKTFEQVVVPQKQEITTLPAFRFSFFDPNAQIYRTLTGPQVGLIVRPTAALTSLPGVNPSTRPAVTNDEIVHIKPYLAVSAVAGKPLLEKPWFLAAQVVPLLTWFSLFLFRKRNEALANNPRLRRQREVSRKIADGLSELRRQAAARETDQFFATVFRLLQEQLGERLDLPSSAITEAVIDEHLRGGNGAESTVAALHELFQLCNQARYGAQPSSHELASLIPRVEATLTELRALAPRQNQKSLVANRT